MEKQTDTRRIFIFLGFAFGIAWITGLIIYLTGGLTNSPQIVPGISLALVLLATAYMWAPALGNILTRLITAKVGKMSACARTSRRVGLTGWPPGSCRQS